MAFKSAVVALCAVSSTAAFYAGYPYNGHPIAGHPSVAVSTTYPGFAASTGPLAYNAPIAPAAAPIAAAPAPYAAAPAGPGPLLKAYPAVPGAPVAAAAPVAPAPYAAPVAAAPAAYAGAPAVTASQYHAQDEFGAANYGYSNINSAKQESRDAYGNVVGSYSYDDGTGIPKQVTYIADAYGFRITSSNNLPLHPVDEPAVAHAKAAHFSALNAAALGH